MKKFLVILLALCMMLSLSVTAFAAEYNDTNGHWAEDAIDRWSEYDVVGGKGDGVFDPDGNMKRGEAAQVFANLLKLDGKADLSEFSDVGLGQWYDDAIAKCVKAGIMNGVGDGKMDPNGTITREMFFVMFARALGIQPVTKAEVAISDGAKASDWAAGYITALVNKGYVKGTSSASGGVTVEPKLDINRASVMSLLNQTIATYVNTTEEVIAGDGLILVVVDNAKVSLKNSTGKAEVYAFGQNTVISNAPAGTTVITSDDATGVKVNDKTLGKDTTIVVEETKPAAGGGGGGGGGGPVSHTHSYSVTTPATCTTDGVEACACGDTQTIKATGHVWDADGKCTKTGCTATKETAMKFSLAVESGETKYEKAVTMTVFDDYSFIINVPNSTVDAATVTGTVKMQNVASLGVGEERSHSITVDTGITDHGSIALGTYLSNAWTLSQNTTTVNFNIDGKACTYVITGNNKTVNGATGEGDNAVLYGKPADIEATRAAWQALARHVTTATNESDDSYVSIAGDSYLALGGKKLVMEDRAIALELFKGEWSKETLESDIRDAVKLVEYTGEDGQCVAFVEDGTVLALSSSMATLDEICKITVNGFADDAEVLNALSNLQHATGLQNIVKTLVETVNNAMGDIQGKTITVGISFMEPMPE